MINTIRTSDQVEKRSANYEKEYKQYEGRHQPRITDLDYHIELYPKERGLEVSCRQRMKNKGSSDIDTLFFTQNTSFKSEINLPGSTLLLRDSVLGFSMYKLNKPLRPGDSLDMIMTMRYFQ
jgi:ABC-2 type transport system permease protein